MINKPLLIIIASAMLCSCSLARHSSMPPLEVVPRVELSRYTGTWYEIARYPNSFQKDCIHSSAVYKLKADSSISVLNSCQKKGVMKTAEAKARVADPITNAKLKVSFFWPFWGDYWIIDLEKTMTTLWSPNRAGSTSGFLPDLPRWMTACIRRSFSGSGKKVSTPAC